MQVHTLTVPTWVANASASPTLLSSLMPGRKLSAALVLFCVLFDNSDNTINLLFGVSTCIIDSINCLLAEPAGLKIYAIDKGLHELHRAVTPHISLLVIRYRICPYGLVASFLHTALIPRWILESKLDHTFTTHNFIRTFLPFSFLLFHIHTTSFT